MSHISMSTCGALRHMAWMVGKRQQSSRVLTLTGTHQLGKLSTLLTSEETSVHLLTHLLMH